MINVENKREKQINEEETRRIFFFRNNEQWPKENIYKQKHTM